MGTQIDQEIPELPIPPYKNVDSGATFVTKAEAFRQALKDTFQPAMNYVIGKINIISNEVSTNATNAETAANIATAAANYKGNWVAGYNTTGYSVGMSVTFTDGFNYISKINNNLISPTSKTNTTQWGWIEKYENINGYDEKTTPDDADLLPLSDNTISFSIKKLTWANIKNTIINSFYNMISGLSAKTTVGALDEFVINDSGASTKKVTYQNLINTIATSLGGMISNLTVKITLADTDIFIIGDSQTDNTSKKITWSSIKTILKTYFDGLYLALSGNQTIGGVKSFADSVLVTGSSGGIGYGVGAGGSVTQLTSKSTAVTLNTPTGQITMNNAALAAGASVEFILNNNVIASSDLLYVNCNGFYNYQVFVTGVTNGSCRIIVKNISLSSFAEAVKINFTLIKGANA